MKVRMPDGTIIDAPDGATKAAVQALYDKGRLDYDEMKYSPTAGTSGLQRGAEGIGQGMTELGRGALQTFGMMDKGDLAESARLDADLVNTTGGRVGQTIGKALPAVAASFVPGGNTAAGAALIGGVTGLAEPVRQGSVFGGKLRNAATGAVLSGGAQLGMNKLGEMTSASVADAATKRAANVARDDVVSRAQKEGLKFSPTQINPSLSNRLLEGYAGKITTEQSLGGKNQEVINTLARRSLGLADDVPLTGDTLNQVRASAGQAYEDVKVIPRINWNHKYSGTIQNLGREYQSLIKDIPEMADPQIENLIKAMDKPSFSGKTAVALLKRLRFDGNRNAFNGMLGPRVNELGKSQLDAANALEDLIEDNLKASSGSSSLLDKFRQARTLIAKSYTVQKALNEGAGDVDAAKLAAALKKHEPLSGELKLIGEAAQVAPRSMQQVKRAMPGVSPLDYAAAGGMTAASGNPAWLSTIVGRPIARAAVTSDIYQKLMATPRYGSKMTTMADMVRRSPAGLDVSQATLRALLPTLIYSRQE